MKISWQSILLMCAVAGSTCPPSACAADLVQQAPETGASGATNTYSFVCNVASVPSAVQTCKLTVDFHEDTYHGHGGMSACVVATAGAGRVVATNETVINAGFRRMTIALTVAETNDNLLARYDAEFVTGFNETGVVKDRYTTSGVSSLPSLFATPHAGQELDKRSQPQPDGDGLKPAP